MWAFNTSFPKLSAARVAPHFDSNGACLTCVPRRFKRAHLRLAYLLRNSWLKALRLGYLLRYLLENLSHCIFD
jgi:hypothetical protein